jgi:hypothetical protein
MTWIKMSPPETDASVAEAMEASMRLYPPEYAVPVESLADHNGKNGASIVMAHSLLPRILMHTFAAYGELLSDELPLSREEHEMIAATVSSLNDCFY